MPYESNADLPQRVRSVLPDEAQSVWRKVANAQLDRGLAESRAIASAWAALRNQGWVKGSGTKWIKKYADIAKIDDDRNLVFGWASVAIRKDGEQVKDSQGDLIDPEDLEDAAYLFNLQFRETGINHEGEAIGSLVESFAVTPEKLQKMGLEPDALPQGLWVGFHIEDDAVFEKVKSGEFSMFSIQGLALRESADAIETA